MALVPLMGQPSTREVPGGKLPLDGNFLRLLHGEVEERGGFRGFRGIDDICCTIEKDQCQCKGGDPVVVEAAEKSGEGGSDGALNRKVHCKSRGQPCLMAKMRNSWQEAVLPFSTAA